MMERVATALVLAVLTASLAAQQPNTAFAAIDFDAPASATAPLPIHLGILTDSPFAVHVKGAPGPQPWLLLGSLATNAAATLDLGLLGGLGFDIDIADVGPPGLADQVVLNGFVAPDANSVTDAGGRRAVAGLVPSCFGSFGSPPATCVGVDLGVGLQAIMVDGTALLGVRSTAAATVAVTLGHRDFQLSGNQAGIFDFRDGFTFRFYGKVYTRAWVSANGYISFTPADTGFPSPSVSGVRSAEPRIMSYYSDLEPQVQTYGPRVYARQFTDSAGVRKVKFVHERLSQFGNATGPHGGEIVITENNEIAVFVAPYNIPPSFPHPINVVVGVSPGENLHQGPLATPFGRNLVADVGSGPTTVGAAKLAFELYDHGNLAPVNPMNFIIAFGVFNGSPVGPGVVYAEDPSLPQTSPQTSGYVILP